MEDAVDVLFGPEGELQTEFYAVYDGHGGTEAVNFVKRWLPEAIRSRGGFGDLENLDEVLKEAFTVTDEELLQQLHSQKGLAAQNTGSQGTYVLSSGCVGCVAIVRGGRITVANLGDCRAVICSEGKFLPLTVDHQAISEVNEAERERL